MILGNVMFALLDQVWEAFVLIDFQFGCFSIYSFFHLLIYLFYP